MSKNYTNISQPFRVVGNEAVGVDYTYGPYESVVDAIQQLGALIQPGLRICTVDPDTQKVNLYYYDQTGFVSISDLNTTEIEEKLAENKVSIIDGYWWIGTKNTGIQAQGPQGEQGEAGADGKDGADATAVLTSYVFKRSQEQPEKLSSSEGSYLNPSASGNVKGWTDGIPERTEENSYDVWESHRIFTQNGNSPQQSEWSTPVKLADSEVLDVCYHEETLDGNAPEAPTTHGTQTGEWHNEGTSDDYWMAVSKYTDNTWSNWTITRVKGEKGEKGDKGDKGDAGDGASTNILLKGLTFESDDCNIIYSENVELQTGKAASFKNTSINSQTYDFKNIKNSDVKIVELLTDNISSIVLDWIPDLGQGVNGEMTVVITEENGSVYKSTVVSDDPEHSETYTPSSRISSIKITDTNTETEYTSEVKITVNYLTGASIYLPVNQEYSILDQECTFSIYCVNASGTTFTIAGETFTIDSNSLTRIVKTFTPDEELENIEFSVSNQYNALFSRAQLQYGDSATAWTPGIGDAETGTDYLYQVLIQATDAELQGGLILGNVLALRDNTDAHSVTAGLSGLTEDNVLLWGGGTYTEAVNAAAGNQSMQTLIKNDGTGNIGCLEILSDTSVQVNHAGTKTIIKPDSSIRILNENDEEKIIITPETDILDKYSVYENKEVSNENTLSFGAQFMNYDTTATQIEKSSFAIKNAFWAQVPTNTISAVITIPLGVTFQADLKKVNDFVSTSIAAKFSVYLTDISDANFNDILIWSTVKTASGNFGNDEMTRIQYKCITNDGSAIKIILTDEQISALKSHSIYPKIVVEDAAGGNTIIMHGIIPQQNNPFIINYTTKITTENYINKTVVGLDGILVSSNQGYCYLSNTGSVIFKGLPTSDSGLSEGQLYSDNGTLKIKQ